MDWKKKLSCFFGLKPIGEGGFTLVELIVVVAILGILGGVSVPAYSAYVNKANEAADRQLIADVEHALILGGYSEGYAPGTVVGAVGISKDSNAEATTSNLDNDSTTTETDITAMMEKAFGTGWQETLKLKSDTFANSDSAKMIAAIKANPRLFASVPDSSFYAAEGNTDALVADVDDIAGALSGVLYGLMGEDAGEENKTHGAQFSMFWGSAFHDSVNEAGLTSDWQNDPEMAANLTVFAAANQITGSSSTTQQNWIDSWGTSDPVAVSGGNSGYVADLVMNYAQCVAAYNWAKVNMGEEGAYYEYGGAYEDLETAMEELATPSSNGYVQDFNSALNAFWNNTSSLKSDWKNSGAASKDAEAFLATMMAVNSMEENYVTTDQKELLREGNAFTNAGAAEVLDTMVSYSGVGTLPAGDYVLALTIAGDGTPVIAGGLKEE